MAGGDRVGFVENSKPCIYPRAHSLSTCLELCRRSGQCPSGAALPVGARLVTTSLRADISQKMQRRPLETRDAVIDADLPATAEHPRTTAMQDPAANPVQQALNNEIPNY